MADQFITWLNNPDCIKELVPCARKVIKRAERLGIALDDACLQGADFHNAVASDLWMFLREEAERLAGKFSVFLATEDSEGLSRYIVKEFIDARIDQRRNDSPFHAYYRHMRSVLCEAEGINYQSVPRQGSYFAWSHAEGLPFLCKRLTCTELYVTSRTLRPSKFTLTSAARYFSTVNRSLQ